MGQDLGQVKFTDKDHQAFNAKLQRQLTRLKHRLSEPSFGDEQQMFGAELELYLIDESGNASPNNQTLLTLLNDDQFQPELNQYNIELNLSAVNQSGTPFSALDKELSEKLEKLRQQTHKLNSHALPIGILPTLTKTQLNIRCMTPINRYTCLAEHIYQQRGENFPITINGKDHLATSFQDICAEGANTSFQFHLMVAPNKLEQCFNAAQLTLPLVTAIGANSPIFLGKSLWHETRIALFKQSLDIRLRDQVNWREPTRVNFGFGWVRQSIWELFSQAVALYPTLIPNTTDDSEDDNFNELNFHMGTIWPWHRPVLSPRGNGHVRIEFRAIPAGPSQIDMLANAAFAVGLAVGLSADIDELISVMPFEFAEYNFYRAAQHGLDAKILWPSKTPYQVSEVDIKQVIGDLLDTAHQGLTSLNISSEEADYYLTVIERRLANKMSGAIWQMNTFEHLKNRHSVTHATQQLVQHYLAHYQQGEPVTQWQQLWK